MTLLSVAAARLRVFNGALPTTEEQVPLFEAAGRVLGQDLAATVTQPPFDCSAMDGYAVRRLDVTTLPARLAVIGEVAAGGTFAGRVSPGTAVRIFTGAPLPDGADAIVIQESTEAGSDGVIITQGLPDPAHIRRRGMDFSEGDMLLGRGRCLDARALALAAAMGHAQVPVFRRPVVAIIATGDELVLPGTRPGPGQVICSNPYGLAAMINAAGGTARFLGIAGDDRDALTALIDAGAEADVLVTIGGASVGDYDLVASALGERGMELDFWRIAMRPGKPLLFGRLGAQRVLGFPGNPVSTLICARVFLVPLIGKLLGLNDSAQDGRRFMARLAIPIEANGPRTHYMRATTGSEQDGKPTVTPAESQDSSLLRPLADADCLIIREPHAPALAAGEDVVILTLDF